MVGCSVLRVPDHLDHFRACHREVSNDTRLVSSLVSLNVVYNNARSFAPNKRYNNVYAIDS